MLIDTHCHLDAHTYGDEAGVVDAIRRARAAGVRWLIHIASGYAPEVYQRAAALAAEQPNLWYVAGVHPHDASRWGPEVADALREAVADPRLVALGEMGLDFHYDMSPRDLQRQAFREQIRLALALRKPIVIHDRSSEGETLDILDDEGAFAVPVLYHCFTGDRAAMEAITARGGYVSIPGIVTFKNAEPMREVARTAPADRLLVETDSPYLTPIPHRGKRNEPAYVRFVAEKVAELRGVSVDALAQQVAVNAGRFFGIELVADG